MTVLTLISDSGWKDHYLPAVKGFVLSNAAGTNLVDITHGIAPFNVGEAAFVLRNCWRHFPEGTIHLAGVAGGAGNPGRWLAAQVEGQFFVVPDNGFLSLMLDEEPEQVVELKPERDEDLLFPLLKVGSAAAVKLLNGKSLADLGEATQQYLRLANLAPLVEEKMLKGTVIYVDRPGNAIINLRKKDFRQFGKKPFRLYTSRNEYFRRLHQHYHEVPEGEKVAFFNSSGYLEIAINHGNASQLLGLELGKVVLVEFK